MSVFNALFLVFVVFLCEQYVLIQGSPVINSTTFRNIDYVGRGYDGLFGNPLSTRGPDPGYRMPVFSLPTMATSIQPVDDQRFLLPLGVDARETVSCRLDWETSIFNTMSSYLSNLQESASMSASYNGFVFKGSFSASTDYRNVRSSLATSSSAFSQSSATCSVYTAELRLNDLPPLHSYFVSEVIAVSGMGSGNSFPESALLRLINQFGTHFPISTVMGARFGQQSEISSSYYNSQSYSSLRASAELSVSALSSSLTASAMFSNEQDQAASFSSNCSHQSLFTVGSAPPANGDALTWAAIVSENPAPIQISKFVPVYTLMNPQQTGGDPGKLLALTTAMSSYVNSTYCSNYGFDCNGVASVNDECFAGTYTAYGTMPGGRNMPNPLIGRLGCPLGYDSINAGPFFYCINSNRTKCYAGSTSVSTFGGFYTTSSGQDCVKYSNPWTNSPQCTSDMSNIKMYQDANWDGQCERTTYICLPSTRAVAVVGGGFGIAGGNTTSFAFPNMWPPGGPYFAQCPLGYGAFLIGTSANGDKAKDGNFYLCLLTSTTFFERFQLSSQKPVAPF